MRTSNRSYLLLLILFFLLAVLFGRFFDFITNINSYVLSLTGDGLKNYYTYLYYAKWGQGDVLLNGMAYPFGEHIVYTDAQPILALILNFLQRHGYDVAQYGVGILNGLMLGSILVSSIFIYLIVKRFKYPAWYTFFITVIITLLSPQIYRMSGHYGLASVFFIPCLWYFLIKAEESKRAWLWLAGILFVITLHGLMHPYYLPIGAFFLLSYGFVLALQNRKVLGTIKYRLMYMVLVAILPLIIFKTWTAITDNMTDRPKYPYGILEYHSSFDSVFLPSSGPGHDTVNYFISTHPKWEGWAFVGWTSTLVLIFSLIRVYKWVRAKRYRKIFLPALPSELRTMLWASVIILLVSMAFPFRLGMSWLLELLPSLKQFRSLGRFAWIFYYVFTVYAAYYLYGVFRLVSRRHKQFGTVFISLILIVWFTDAWISFANATSAMRDRQENVFIENAGYDKLLSEHSLTIDSFQAILPLPFFVGGTEKIDTYKAELGSHGFVVSYQTGLPMAAVMSARFPYERGQKLKQLLSADEIEKTILKEYKNDKPLLVIHTVDNPLCEEELRLLKKCRFLGHIEGADLFQLDIHKLQTHSLIVKKYESVKDSLMALGGYLYTARPGSLYRKSFEDTQDHRAIFGKGFIVTKEEDQVIIKDLVLPVREDSITYELSLWMYLDPAVTDVNGFNLFRYTKNDSLIARIDLRQEATYDLYKGWERLSFVFTSLGEGEKIKLECAMEGITIDEIVLKPLDVDVYYEINDISFVKNNYFIIK